jgi:hypothetical protein
MPLARYFLYVGGVLLTLLFLADAWLPKPAARVQADAFQPAILIYSNRNWPERIVYNTSTPALSANRGPYIPAPERNSLDPVKAREAPAKTREAFAEMRPSDTRRTQPIHSAKPAPRPSHMRRIVQKIPRTMFAMAQRPFGNRFIRMW